MGHIFISYSHKDKKYVEKLEKKLISEGFDVWIDHRIDYGDDWLRVIEKNLDECDAFIIVMSENSKVSNMVQNEITRARDIGKLIFPVLLEGGHWLAVQRKQYADVRDGSFPPEKFYKRLAKETPRERKDKLVSIALSEVKKGSAQKKPSVREKRRVSKTPLHKKNEFSLGMIFIVIGGVILFIVAILGFLSLKVTSAHTPTNTPTLIDILASATVNVVATETVIAILPQVSHTHTPNIGATGTVSAALTQASYTYTPNTVVTETVSAALTQAVLAILTPRPKKPKNTKKQVFFHIFRNLKKSCYTTKLTALQKNYIVDRT